MSLLDVDSWSRECEACAGLNETIRGKLTQREKRQRNSVEYNCLTAALESEFKQFNIEVEELKKKLDILEKTESIGVDELNHRKQQVDVLQTHLAQVQRLITRDLRLERTELFAQPSYNFGNIANDSNETTLPEERSSDVNALKQRQIDILEDQNRGLEILSQTISRQRSLASQLGQEVESQNDILDNLANTMERVDVRVHAETGNISEVNRKDSTWGYWLLIIILFVVIIIVAVI